MNEHQIREGEIFVFGSNLAGRHGKGAALTAKQQYGAQYGIGVGPTGFAYALPTKDENLNTLPLSCIAGHVNDFITYAEFRPDEVFFVTAVGTGLAGYRHEDIAPLFTHAPTNCRLPPEWTALLRPALPFGTSVNIRPQDKQLQGRGIVIGQAGHQYHVAVKVPEGSLVLHLNPDEITGLSNP